MTKLIALLAGLSLVMSGLNKSFDYRIMQAINSQDFFAIDSLYSEAPKDSLNAIIDEMARACAGNAFNRPELVNEALNSMLYKSTHASELDPHIQLTFATMYAYNLIKEGYYSEAAAVLSDCLDYIKEYLSSDEIEETEESIKLYKALAEYNPYSLTIESGGAPGIIPFCLKQVGIPEDQNCFIQLENCFIDGLEADIVFSIGSSHNYISDSLAIKYNLIPLDCKKIFHGDRDIAAKCVITKELKLGNIVLRDVPFYVMDITTQNTEADKILKNLNIAVGNELLLHLNELTIDFVNNEITVPYEAPSRTDAKHNMFISLSQSLVTKANVLYDNIFLELSTTVADYGSLGWQFFWDNEEFVVAEGELTNTREAHVGFVIEGDVYSLPNVPMQLGGNTVAVPSFRVYFQDDTFSTTMENYLGLKSLMLYDKVRFNFVDMVLSTYRSQPDGSSLVSGSTVGADE